MLSGAQQVSFLLVHGKHGIQAMQGMLTEVAMALTFFPRAGQIYVCDFTGFRVPEMVKPRPVVVISPRLPFRSEIVTVVPISTTAPRHELPFCYRLSKNYHPGEADDLPSWAKADMLMNLGLYRLSPFKVGRRTYEYPTVTPQDLAGVRHAVLCGLGLDRPAVESAPLEGYISDVARSSGIKT